MIMSFGDSEAQRAPARRASKKGSGLTDLEREIGKLSGKAKSGSAKPAATSAPDSEILAPGETDNPIMKFVRQYKRELMIGGGVIVGGLLLKKLLGGGK